MIFEVIPNEQTPKVDEITNHVDFINNNSEKLKAFMEFANTRDNAVGLAANQCSVDGERFMVRAFALLDLKTHQWELIIDPEITEYVGMEEIKCEGCLTWKDKVVVAKRSRGVKVKYRDEQGNECVGFYKGFEGQIWQHEINHLNGVAEDIHESFDEPKPITIQRNEKCPCGSNKKYKQCCLLLI